MMFIIRIDEAFGYLIPLLVMTSTKYQTLFILISQLTEEVRQTSKEKRLNKDNLKLQ